MTQWHNLKTRSPLVLAAKHSIRQSQRQLLPAFWFVALGLLIYELYLGAAQSPWINFAALSVTAAALLPSFLWCSGQALGMPLFPVFALPYIWAFAMPLLIEHPIVKTYSLEKQLFASFTTAGFLVLGTLIWFLFTKSEPTPPKFYRALSENKGNQFFIAALAYGVLFNVANAGGWLLLLDPGSFSIARSLAVAFTALSTFVLAYRLGARELTRSQAKLVIFLIYAFALTSAISLLLVGAATVFLVATIAFVLGRKQIPVLTILLVVTCLTFLQAGKGEIRASYWYGSNSSYIQVWDYPALYTEWFSHSLKQFSRNPDAPSSEAKPQSFLERSSVLQMLLLVQAKSPQVQPYLRGETYTIIPQLLVPRILNANRLNTLQGSRILSLYYGVLTERSFTSIGWGQLAEAYSNFGIPGCAGLAVVLGAAYGQVSRWSINAPFLSLRSLFAVVVMTYAFQIELVAGTLAAALSQLGMVLLGIAMMFMENYPVKNHRDHRTELHSEYD